MEAVGVDAQPHETPPSFPAGVGGLVCRQFGVGVELAQLRLGGSVAESVHPHAIDRVVVWPLGVLDKPETLCLIVNGFPVLLQSQTQQVQLRQVIFPERNVRPPPALRAESPPDALNGYFRFAVRWDGHSA